MKPITYRGNCNIERIDYTYIYVPEIFKWVLDRKRMRVDEYRSGESHRLLDGDYPLSFLEMPASWDDANKVVNYLQELGIPYLVDDTYTEEYSTYRVHLLNQKLTDTEVSFTSMDELKSPLPEYMSITNVDLEFVDRYSQLRVALLALNPNSTKEDALDAYLTYK